MAANAERERLQLLFKRTATLPNHSHSAAKLVEAIDAGVHSPADIERLVLTDPLVAAMFLRIAGQNGIKLEAGQATLRQAVHLMGPRTVRSIASSLASKQTIALEDPSSEFDSDRFSRHSLAVGFLAGFLYARKVQSGSELRTRWALEEMFGAGVMHDLCIGLLAGIAPDDYARVHFLAYRNETTLETSFELTFGCPPGHLGAIAAEAWGLPEVIVKAIRYVGNPGDLAEEYDALCCLHMAEHLASTRFGLASVPWVPQSKVDEKIEADYHMADEELERLGESLHHSIDQFLEQKAA